MSFNLSPNSAARDLARHSSILHGELPSANPLDESTWLTSTIIDCKYSIDNSPSSHKLDLKAKEMDNSTILVVCSPENRKYPCCRLWEPSYCDDKPERVHPPHHWRN